VAEPEKNDCGIDDGKEIKRNNYENYIEKFMEKA
jgi:hypothetical protein